MRHPLTLYALEPWIKNFDDAIKPEVLHEGSVQVHVLEGEFDFEARLYEAKVEPMPPTWTNFLAAGFPAFSPVPSARARIAVILKIDESEEAFFAATFGSGRYLLQPHAFQQKYGLKVALNSIYEGDTPDAPLPANRLRQVQTTTVSKNTMRTLKQANQDAAWQDFEFDLERDQLGRIVGAPIDSQKWGTRVTGSDAVRIQVAQRLDDVGALCRNLKRAHRARHFEARFSAIEDIRTVDEDKLPELEEALLDLLKNDSHRVALSPNGLVDWDAAAGFRCSVTPNVVLEDISLEVLLGSPDLGQLTIEKLKHETIECEDSDGQSIAQWSLFDCLDTEIRLNDRTYLLVGGRFYSVSESYLEELDEFLSRIPRSDLSLPDSWTWHTTQDGKVKTTEETEGDYNERAAKETGLTLLDKKTVRLPQGGDPIEICDLLSRKGQLIHVKRKFSSSSLSHLFSQGWVSGELFAGNKNFRSEFREELISSSLPSPQRFSPTEASNLVPEERPNTTTYEIVYAIIGDWKGEGPGERLPFFSKINLRRFTQDLRALGYKVGFYPINLKRRQGQL